MAKGKHAAALFEVIHAGKQMGARERSGLLRTPKWWFKGRTRESNAAADSPPATAAAADPPAAPPAEPRPPAVDLLLDPDRHQITFRVSYTSAIVTAFSVLVVVVLAYVVGRSMARGPAQAMGGPSTEQIREGPPRPEVLDVSGGSSDRRPTASNTDPESGTSAPPAVVSPPNGVSGADPTRRIQGINYVIIQGYPDEANAKAAVDVLKQNGVGCTIEKGFRGLKSDWFFVVGTDGFTRIRAPEYETYVKKIQQISDKAFAGKRNFKAFEPMPYKWDRP